MKSIDRARIAPLMVREQKRLRGCLLLLLGASIWWTGCASIGPPLPPSLELPKPPTDLHAVRKGDRVTLTWTIPARTTDRQSVRYLGKTRICRSVGAGFASVAAPPGVAAAPVTAAASDAGTTLGVGAAPKECGTPVGDAPPPADFTQARKSSPKKLPATFTDILSSAMQQSNPASFAAYAVEVLNAADRGAGISNQVRVPLVPTVAPFGGFRAQATAQGVLISWQCPPTSGTRTDVKYLFRIYRHAESKLAASKIADVDATDCAAEPSGLVPSFLDQTFEWESTYFYRGAVVSVMETAGKPTVEVEGDDTPEVKVFAHDVFPPAVPSGLQAVFSGPGQQPFIDLIWAPVTDADLDGYNIYRHQDGTVPVKLTSTPVRMPAFRDTQVLAGKKYSYSVSAVDQRGNESARSEEADEDVP
jgi:hypothetical protein